MSYGDRDLAIEMQDDKVIRHACIRSLIGRLSLCRSMERFPPEPIAACDDLVFRVQ
jgi:hypothetical protein